jgi:nucleoside-diphosphate-sugar epimerase
MERFYSGRRVLVTGGSGVIGKELLQLLIGEGATVMNVDREPLPATGYESVEHLQVDLTDCSMDDLVLFKPEMVFHLAAGFERSEESPEFWKTNWDDNVIASHRVLDIERDMPQCEAFIFASSYLVYSTEHYLTTSDNCEIRYLKEEDSVKPRNICGAAKFYTENEMGFVRDHYNSSMRTLSARIYRVYGLDSKEVVNRWVRAALAGETIDVYNKRNMFDYIFSRDVAEGLVRLGTVADASGVINLSSGSPRSIEDVLGIISTYLPRARELIADNGVKDVFEFSAGNIDKLREVTGWTPDTSLEAGIKRVVDHEVLSQGGSNGL